MVSEDALGQAPRIVTLLTDFGLADAYVGVVKGVILGRAPHARLVDLTHDVAPQVVEHAAFLLETALPVFPQGTVHLVVVDPAVGTGRRRLALAAGAQLFVGPDNGCLSAALPESVRGRRSTGEGYEARSVDLPPEIVAVSIDNETLFRQPVSATFEARDVFGPAAAHLANGGALSDLGPRVERIEAFPTFRAPRVDGGLEGLVLYADRFGNLITDVLDADLPPDPTFAVAFQRLKLVRTYAEASGTVAIAGSGGYIEIAVPNGDAALVLGAGPGDRVRVTPG